MAKWHKELPTTVKGMIIVIVVIIIGIILRWEYVSRESARAIKDIFKVHETPKKEDPQIPEDSLPAADADTLRVTF